MAIPMTVADKGFTTLNPRAEAKFAAPGIPGRVLNTRAETATGGGTAEIQLKSPDGSITKLADAVIPTLAKDEKCIFQVRVSTGIAKATRTVAEVG